MPNNYNYSQQEKCIKSIQQFHRKRKNQYQKKTQNSINLQAQDDIFLDLKNIWQTRTKTQQKQYQAIRTSELFSEKRKVTFVRFNYRCYENKDLNYQEVYNKLIKKQNKNDLSNNKIHGKGTMHISELWSQRKLKQVIGNLPFPRDRLKVLKIYPKKNNRLYLGPTIRPFSRRLLTE